ncbi:MAG: class I SAM-dependent methyltransferase, partial [Pseudomonadota bacterium]
MSLAALLQTRIAASGPMTIADYMAEALLNPDHGYYTTRTPFGAEGDFITAPEMTQMFGELIGLCIAQSWMGQGKGGGRALVHPGLREAQADQFAQHLG